MTTEQIVIFVMGMVTAAIMWSFYKIVVGVINGYPTRISEKQIIKLIDSLQRQGFKVYQVITGRHDSDKDALAGYLLRPRLTSKENAELRRSKFKVVVSN